MIELCMRGYRIYSEATAGEGLLVSPGTRRTVTVMPSASCGNIFRVFNICGLTSSANTAKISPP